ncbi:probable E3 ubiquitin-protein ligase HIP1 [Macadamia integrifolia]|uniref:probable E3 ubiquitin-protein ligase HIP1 n=1 Tax=Macadamia integrifolia TaxID=60698 RepID=UPI001C4EED22|nr:probable E3 ubiquitin-protein ligase HIP1 [Macadamia integrifolia]
MQGQRSTVDNFPETFEFDHGSSSSNTGVNQQLFWNNMINPVESRLPEYILSPGETSIMYGNAVNPDGRSLSGWSLGEPSSSGNARSQMRDETKTEHGWSSSMSAPAGVGSRLEERRYEPTSILSLESVNINLNSNQDTNGPLLLHHSSSDGIAQNINLNASYIGSSSNGDQAMEGDASPHTFNSGGSDMEQIPSGSGSSDPLGTAAGSGYILEENNGRPGCSLDGRRLSCKRKALEGTSGQSSLGGGPSWFQQADSSAWHAVAANNNGASSSSVPTPLENSPVINPAEQSIPRFGVGMRVTPGGHPALSVAVGGESSQRNFRVRVNHAQPQDSVSPNPLSTGNAIRHSQVWSSHQASRLLPFNQSLESRLSSLQANMNHLQSQSHVMHIPGLGQNVHPFPWNGSSNSRVGSLSNSSVIAGERSAALREESNPRSMPRTISEHPMFIPATEMRTLAQDPTSWNLPIGNNVNILGNAASTSQIGSSSGVHPSAPAWIPHPNPPSLHSQRLSEFVRRSLLSSEPGAQTSPFTALRSGPSGSSQEMVLPSGASHQGHHRPHSRSAFLAERQGDGVLGIPFSLRTLAAAGEGRSRLVSEIRNVLDLMRRGEGLRFEDVLILDQSVFYGVADLHDRHRDMRLDVDNMSYEELLALEERIGNVSTGLSEETILKCLKQHKYLSISMRAPTEVEPCCICQEEYVDGEDIGTLNCGHDFHTGCVKRWLTQKNLCPICKMTALDT